MRWYNSKEQEVNRIKKIMSKVKPFSGSININVIRGQDFASKDLFSMVLVLLMGRDW